jgi:hypothetical protein
MQGEEAVAIGPALFGLTRHHWTILPSTGVARLAISFGPPVAGRLMQAVRPFNRSATIMTGRAGAPDAS